MYTRNNNKIVAVIALCVAVIGLSVGFAALSTTLTINGTTTVQGSSWGIIFDNVQNPVTTTADGLSTAPTCTKPSITGNTTLGTFAADLRGPGDSCTIEFDIKNNGNYNAKITGLSGTAKTCSGTICGYITYTFKYKGGNAVAVNDTLTAGQSRTVQIVASYATSATTVNTGAQITVNTSPITITYGQA